MSAKAKAEQEQLIAYIAERVDIGRENIQQVLRYEQAFIESTKANADGELEIDIDDLTDYIFAKKDVALEEPQIEEVLELEMAYWTEQGLAGYLD